MYARQARKAATQIRVCMGWSTQGHAQTLVANRLSALVVERSAEGFATGVEVLTEQSCCKGGAGGS